MKDRKRRGLWLGALALILFLPIIFYTFGLGRLHTSIWSLFLSLTGTQAAGLFAYVLALGTRFRSKTSEFGVPLHRWSALLLLALVTIHINLALLSNPDNVWLLSLWNAPARGTAATAAWLCIIVLIGLGSWRTKFGLKSDAWRRFHVGIAWAAALLAFCHILWIDQLVNDPLWQVLFASILLITGGMWVTKYLKRG